MEDLRKVYENFVVNGVSALMGGKFDQKNFNTLKYEGLYNGIPNNYVGYTLTNNLEVKNYDDASAAQMDDKSSIVQEGVHPKALAALGVIVASVLKLFGTKPVGFDINGADTLNGKEAALQSASTAILKILDAVKGSADHSTDAPKYLATLADTKRVTSGKIAHDTYETYDTKVQGYVATTTYLDARNNFAAMFSETYPKILSHDFNYNPVTNGMFLMDTLYTAEISATTKPITDELQKIYEILFPVTKKITPDMMNFIVSHRKSNKGKQFLPILKVYNSFKKYDIVNIEKIKPNDLFELDTKYLGDLDWMDSSYKTLKPVYSVSVKGKNDTWTYALKNTDTLQDVMKHLITVLKPVALVGGSYSKRVPSKQYGGANGVDKLVTNLKNFMGKTIDTKGQTDDAALNELINILAIDDTAKKSYDKLYKPTTKTTIVPPKIISIELSKLDKQYNDLFKNINLLKDKWTKNGNDWVKKDGTRDPLSFLDRDQTVWLKAPKSTKGDLASCVKDKDQKGCIAAFKANITEILPNFDIDKIDIETAWNILDALHVGRTDDGQKVESYHSWFTRTKRKLAFEEVAYHTVQELTDLNANANFVYMMQSFIALINANPDILSKKVHKTTGQNEYKEQEPVETTPKWFAQKMVKTSKLKELEDFLQRKDMNTAMDRSALSQFIGYPTGWLKDYQPFGVSSMLKTFGLYGGGLEDYDTLRKESQSRPFVEMIDKIDVAKKALTEGKKYLSDDANNKLDKEIKEFKDKLDELIKQYIIINDAVRIRNKIPEDKQRTIEQLDELRKEHIPLLKGVSKRYDMLGRRLAQIFNSLVESPEGKSLIGNVQSALLQSKTPQRL